MTPSLTGARGLSAAEVAQRRVEYGPNALPQPRPQRLSGRVVAQLRDPLIIVLLVAMAVTMLLRDVSDLVVIALVVLVNTTVGVVQEVRADRAVAALRRLAAGTARVVRDGVEVQIPSVELVPGDLVRVEAGDIVPADLRLFEAVRLAVDEAALTGESVPVGKQAPDDTLAAGTVAVTGRALGEVTGTGPRSALGQIAALVAAQPRRATPLQLRLAALGKVFAVVAAALSTVVFAVGVLRGLPVTDMVLTAVSLTVAAVPESLPAVVTLALAIGAHRMARRAAIVRRLPAVETLGSVTVLATDKTGTLTEGVMSVDRIHFAGGGEVRLTGRGYEPEGDMRAVATGSDGTVAVTLDRTHLLRALVLCNDADLAPPGGDETRWTPIGDPMEAALLVAANRGGVGTDTRELYPRLSERPFDPAVRRMSTLHRTPDGDFLVLCKGAPDALLAPDGPLAPDPDEHRRAAEIANLLTADGFRVLAVAERATEHQPDPSTMDSALRLLGLVALADPVRPQARDAVAALSTAGVRLMLITGDHPATAAAVADRVGIFAVGGRVVLGDHLEAAVPNASVYARTRPDQKLTIVQALQDAGEVVAMTGDGVNDAPALRRADIGVAMGRGGTEAARQAADLVLADDNLATVGAAIEEGRRIYANIRRFLAYALSGGFAEILIMLAGPWLGLAVPLLPAQILWVNMLTHGLPGVALGAEPADPDLMRQPPRPPNQAILRGLAGRIVGTGTLIGAVALAAALVAHAQGRAWQSVLFTVLGLAQLGVALALRARHTARRNWGLDAAVALSLILQLAALWLAPLRELLGTQSLSLTEVAACATLASVPAIVISARDNLARRH